MNVSTDFKIIHSGTFVASLSRVDKVVESEERFSYSQGKTLPPALNHLIKKTIKRVIGKQRNQIKELLVKHKSSFASNDQELGKTDIVTHGIKTDNRAPSKQPLRRIPVHIRKEVDKQKVSINLKPCHLVCIMHLPLLKDWWKLLSGMQWDICPIYLDDIIVIAKSFEEMLENLEKVFLKLSSAGLKLKANKCHIFAEQVEFLGHIISPQEIATDPKKLEVIRDWKEPSNVSEVRSFVGVCSYYRRYIKNFAGIVKPFNKLTKKKQKFVWTKECQELFDSLKSKLSEAPILSYPNFWAIYSWHGRN